MAVKNYERAHQMGMTWGEARVKAKDRLECKSKVMTPCSTRNTWFSPFHQISKEKYSTNRSFLLLLHLVIFYGQVETFYSGFRLRLNPFLNVSLLEADLYDYQENAKEHAYDYDHVA
ncbi:hypothetical protein BpHYR1_011179 [Brachionus plicatilis]|uniref:Uncharacterized protein n=1 Tax=Brachionus plicatilis TaxID=10195 RepID=A0A3M7QWM6_BRAPC|nr:hypothetical protein BpHYR1_011179 [Brachionus plicatilis]